MYWKPVWGLVHSRFQGGIPAVLGFVGVAFVRNWKGCYDQSLIRPLWVEAFHGRRGELGEKEERGGLRERVWTVGSGLSLQLSLRV